MKYTDVVRRVPSGKIGKAAIIHDKPDRFTRLRAAINGFALDDRTHVRLVVGDTVYMTDAQFERRTNFNVVLKAKGDVLIAGLGIGLILDPIIEKAKTVTVVEREADVITLVGRHFPKAQHVQADIFQWTPPKGAKWDTIYFDIWPDICEDDLEEAKALRKRYRKYLRRGGWMGSWTTYANRVVHRSY